MLEIGTLKWMVAATLWTSSVALMIGGTLRDSVPMMAWATFVALVACIVSGHLIAICAVRRERIRVESLVDMALEKALEESRLSRVR